MTRIRFTALCVLSAYILSFLSPYLRAQSSDATITGSVTDTSKAIIRGAKIDLINVDTGVHYPAISNGSGIYSVAAQVGNYRMEVEHSGFKTIITPGIILHTQDIQQINFEMAVGSTAESVTVSASTVDINTTDGSVSTVIDRQFVENIPMNGRSFQTLILLSPGVVTATPQGTDNGGEFSVNGQRTNANNYLLDGVSANNAGGSVGSSSATAGMVGNGTALGTTQAILSVDALQEFRIATSSYSAEYGRQPGAQISFQSRSGGNAYHGTAFDYFRNDALDANNWFNDYSTPALTKPAERQNDFGGVLGGPLSIPKMFSGRDRAFFFFSYEGLRLSEPAPATVFYAPSNGTFNTATYSNPLYRNLRANAPGPLQPALNGFPLPNCSVQQDPQCVDYGDGLSPVLMGGSSPSSIDAISVRSDVQVFPWLRVFARYSDTESREVKEPSGFLLRSASTFRVRAFLLGADSAFHSSIVNQLRLQYSPSSYLGSLVPTQLGGAQPLDLAALHGLPPVGEFVFDMLFPNGDQAKAYQLTDGSEQFQPNAVDTVTWTYRRHSFKAGVDYRQTTAYIGKVGMARSPVVLDYFSDPDQILQNSLDVGYVVKALRQDPITKNLGLFFQDEWRATARLSLSLGLRWDLNPPPSVSGSSQYTYAGNLADPSTLTLAPLGTPLYKTTYTDFAPRFGAAVTLHDSPGHETVIRGGVGLFYDTGQDLADTYGEGYSLGTGSTFVGGSSVNVPMTFPVPASIVLAPIPPVAAPYSMGYLPDKTLHPPSTIQWSSALEQGLGEKQTLIINYVGAAGRGLTFSKDYSTIPNPLFANGTFVVLQNGPGSNYNSLQLQYKRQLSSGLQVVAAYTWAHAIDWDSSDYHNFDLPSQRGNADHDVRNNFTSALVYNLPKDYAERWQRQILGNWNTDLRFIARSAFPVQVQGPTLIAAGSGISYASRLDYNGGYPYVHVKGIPGGRQYNPAIFSVPQASENGNGNAPRNFVRGFGETELDMALQRDFAVYERMHLQFRAEAFNLPNHPNFGAVNTACGATTPGAACTNPLMGQATNTLSNALSGLASIYQQGGPRSMQLGLKLQF